MDSAENILREWERAGGIYALAAQMARAELMIEDLVDERGTSPARNDAPRTNPQREEGGSNG